MKTNKIKELYTAKAGQTEVLQGNIAFAVGCVRAGIHAVEGYPGTPSTEVIDRGLSQVQDMIKVGWSVNEAVAVATAFGHTVAGSDTVVTMKIPGLFQAGDVFTSSSFYHQQRGALIYFIASDFTPSSTQHLVDPHALFKGCGLPVFEPTNHQEMMDAPAIAIEVGRTFNTPVVILASGALCHSEGLVELKPVQNRLPAEVSDDLRQFNCLPGMARANYNAVLKTRLPGLIKMTEESHLNRRIGGSGKIGVISCGVNTMFVQEVKQAYNLDVDVLTLGFTNPLPEKLIGDFCDSISGEIYVVEDGTTYIQDKLAMMGVKAKGKDSLSNVTEYEPESIAELMGLNGRAQTQSAQLPDAVIRPPMICAGCPYRLFAEVVGKLKERGKVKHLFGDIGCNSLLYFLNAMDTGLAMGASEAERAGYVLAKPDMADKCISIIGDSTECHSGMDATRSTVFRNVPGVKVILDNYWTAMTGGQPSPASPVNLAGEPNNYDLVGELRGSGVDVEVIDAYDVKSLRKSVRQALAKAGEGKFSTLVVRGACIKKVPNSEKGIKLKIDKEKCEQCETCQICSGTEMGPDGFPTYNNLCSGCGSHTPACLQLCPFGAIEYLADEDKKQTAVPDFAEPPEIVDVSIDREQLPKRLSLAIRGIGGQGNLFFGRVLTQLAFLAGYDETNIVKGETHGMAQMGGPVISTFSCGNVYSPVLLPGEADCLVGMEMSELLRPGFLELLAEGGTILCAETKVVPQTITPDQYPDPQIIRKHAGQYNLIEIDVLGKALEIGDSTGRIANVVMMGALSKTSPLDVFPCEIWLKALQSVTPHPKLWAANYAAFHGGRDLL